MPITFACECKREFTVTEKLAGKKARCPACDAIVVVPEAPSPQQLADEDVAFNFLNDGNDKPDPDRPHWSEPSSSAQSNPTPAQPRPLPKFRKPMYERHEEQPQRSGGGIHISSGVLGGMAMMLGAVIWFVVGWISGVIFFYPPVMFILGLIAVVKGFLGHSED